MGSGDDLAEFAIDFLLSGRGSARKLTRTMVQRWPERAALEFTYALAVAASGIEDVLSGDETRHTAQDCWRMAALVCVYLFVAQSAGLPHLTGADLMAYWQAHDRFFLQG